MREKRSCKRNGLKLFEKSDRSQTVTRRSYGWEKPVDLIWKKFSLSQGNAPAEEVAPVEEPVVEPVEGSEKSWSTSSSSSGFATFWRNLWRKPKCGEEFTAVKVKTLGFVGPVPEAEFANPDSTEVTQEYVPSTADSRVYGSTCCWATQVFAGQLSQKQVQFRKTKGSWKRRVERNFLRRKLGLFLPLRFLWSFGSSLLLLPVYNTCRSDCR